MDIYIGFDGRHRFFRRPVEVLRTDKPGELPGLFERIEAALRAGYYVAGFLAYEAGYAFESRLDLPGERDFPLLHFGVYAGMDAAQPAPLAEAAPVRERRLDIDFAAYQARIQTIRDLIRAGDVYQITYCVRNRFRYEGDAAALFQRLWRRQPVPYPAFLDAGDYQVLSLSPELFLHKRGAGIVTKPMKGTWVRGRNFFTDWRNRRRLHFDEKNRAENVMIADLMRNDLGRIGSVVRVPKLFEVATYTTLHQMTSTVTAQIPPDIRVGELFRALFPSGSVTGAPKIRAMQVIRDVEDGPRRIHTGAIGFISPDREMFFNVAIRTLLLREGAGEMGVGGGIVWDSTSEGEYEECQIKSAFLGGGD